MGNASSDGPAENAAGEPIVVNVEGLIASLAKQDVFNRVGERRYMALYVGQAQARTIERALRKLLEQLEAAKYVQGRIQPVTRIAIGEHGFAACIAALRSLDEPAIAFCEMYGLPVEYDDELFWFTGRK